MNKLFLSLVFPVVLAHVPAYGACQDLMEELRVMRKAQQSLLTGLADNHETFASAIEDMTSMLKLSSEKASRPELLSMNRKAQAFRKRGRSAQRQTERLDAATADLISRIEDCLKD
ncbi:MAG: hypothetical protein KF802_11060 [Bdellovibrionaceae bacterium]|nr:hypothetical protein [Pseudobdellovibrionaceae bacterium]